MCIFHRGFGEYSKGEKDKIVACTDYSSEVLKADQNGSSFEYVNIFSKCFGVNAASAVKVFILREYTLSKLLVQVKCHLFEWGRIFFSATGLCGRLSWHMKGGK